MKLLRISEFCRTPGDPAEPSSRIQVSIAVTAVCPRNSHNACHNCCSVAYVIGDILIALSLREGDYGCLVFGATRLTVRLYLILNEEGEEEEETDDDVMCGDSTIEASGSKVYLPPIAVENLGNPSERDLCFLKAADHPPKTAALVTLRPFGRPPIWPRIDSTLPNVKGNTDADHYWTYPSVNTMVEKSQLLSVYDPVADRLCCYQVKDVTSDAGGVDGCDEAHLISASTVFELDTSAIANDYEVPTFPSLLAQKQFHASHGRKVEIPHHPDITKLTQSLRLPAETPSNERILHVAGTDREHDLSSVVEAASHHSGRTCWSLRGLAAFAHSKGHQVRSGSLADQMAGLKAAFDEIRTKRMEPCVLHLHAVDEELSSSDATMWHEQEQRIWALIIQELTKTYSYHGLTSGTRHRTSCPIVVVLSTSGKLQPGPWLESLVFPSIGLSLPDTAYIFFLWKDAPWSDDFEKLLRGRPCREIQNISEEVKGIKEVKEVRKLVETMCKTYDTHRRKERSATVAQVRWEDVGGLFHVRDEIMDAVELPLKHPHLFSGGSGRGGILLYGAPGTGKTLVAKAVATECGLPFMSVKGPELLGSYVGESEANVRAVFQSARAAAEQNTSGFASILFFDELDSLAPKRGNVGDGGGVMERVVATLLAELDTDSASKGRVFVLGATNRPDLLDPSLLRPGRLDRCVYLGIPSDEQERAQILAAQLQRLNLERDPLVMSKEVVRRLPGRLTGADFSTIASGALLRAVERLCSIADRERDTLSQNLGTDFELHEVLQGWDEARCTPIITMTDILEASEAVVPSVSEEDLARYESLKSKYSAGNTGAAVEHEGDVFYQTELH